MALHDAVWSTVHYTIVDVIEDTNGFTESVVDLICKTAEATVPKITIKSFHNQKP